LPVLTGSSQVGGAHPAVLSNTAPAGTDQITVTVNNQTVTGTSMPAGLSQRGRSNLASGPAVTGFTLGRWHVQRLGHGQRRWRGQARPGQQRAGYFEHTACGFDRADRKRQLDQRGSQQALVVSGTTDAQVGSEVSLVLNGQTYTAQVQAGAGNSAANTYWLSVPAQAVQSLPSGAQSLQLSVTNRYGSVTQLSPSLTVDKQAPGQQADGTDAAIAVPAVVIAETAQGLSATELADGIQAQVTLPTGSVAGDVIA
jgi:hypothetical protein